MLPRWTALTLVLLAAAPAAADGPFEGQWREGAMNIQVNVHSWGGDCGPRPQSTRAGGGGTFQITQSGDHLTFHLRRQRTTRSCWSENRAVRRVSSSHQGESWRVVCRTPPEDSRAETGTYVIQAVGDSQLSFRDHSEYDWQLNESQCRATILTTQTFSRVGPAPSTPTPSEATPTPEPAPARCTPGEAARVVLRPSSADVQPGGEQCFTARVLDRQGCPLEERPRLAVAEGGAGRMRGLCYHATEAEGSVTIVATAGELTDEAQVSVHTMDLSDLIARRSESGSVGSGTPDEDVSTETAARVTTRSTEESPDLLIPGVAIATALLMVAVAAVLLVQRRRKKPGRDLPVRRAGRASAPPAEAVSAPAATVAPEPPAEAGPPPADEGPREDLICPTCRRGYPPTVERCPHDETALMPYRDFAAGRRADGRLEENVCPTCGKRYPTTTRFCGEDGSTLEPAAESG